MNDFESRLRDSLRRHADQAPDGRVLAERIVRAAERGAGPRPASRRFREWRTWAFPLAAAGAVAALAAVLVGVNSPHHAADPATGGPLSGPRSGAPSGVATGPGIAPTAGRTAPPASPTTSALPAGLAGVRVLDATFGGPDDGWLLASADCLNGQPGKCTALLRTTDGGLSWTSVSPPPANVPGVQNCAAPCVDHIRFANSSTGYAYGDGYYGSSAFYLTTDGGKTWHEQPGVEAQALESYDNNVIRVSPTQPGCGPPGCTYQVETAAIGSTAWTTHALPAYAGGMTSGVQLVRGGNHDAYLLVTGHPAGGAQNATSTLYRSTDDGQTWATATPAEPCPQTNGEVDSVSVAAGGSDRVSVLCVTRQAPQRAFVAVSTDAGAHFSAASGRVPLAAASSLTGDPATVLLASGGSHAYRSTDGGASWQPVLGPSGAVTWAGFESTTVGRIVAGDGRTLWTTRDAGAHWTPLTFG